MKPCYAYVLILAQLLCNCWAKQSNIILLLTDDQDLVLGGMTPLAFTKQFMEGGGSTLTNFFGKLSAQLAHGQRRLHAHERDQL